MKQQYLNLGVFFSVLCLASFSLPAAKIGSRGEVRELQAEVAAMKEEIDTLELSVESLDDVEARLVKELLRFEAALKSRLRELVIPLIYWPKRIFTFQAKSWIEFERVNFVLSTLKHRLVAEPLEMMSRRELRLSEVGALRNELSSNLSQLRSKKDLLNLQLDELRSLQGQSRKKISHATSETKRDIGDIESNTSVE